MREEKLFDLVCGHHDAKGKPFKFETSKGEVTIDEDSYNGILNKAIQAFVHKEIAISNNSTKKTIQAFEGSSALPKLTKDVFNVTMQVKEFDLFWQNAYKGVKLKKGQLEWEIANVTTAITFLEIPEGGKVQFEKVSGSKISATIVKYGAGLGITWETIEGRKLYRFVEQMEDMRAELYTLWANIHYGLLATAGATNPITWQGTASDRVIDRDALTLNEGGYQLGLVNKDKGYGDTANTMFQLYCDPKLRARIKAALRMTSGEATAGQGIQGVTVDYNIVPYFTFNSNIPANKALLVLPGNKIQNAAYMRELGLSKQDIESLNELRTYWTAFGAIVGDNDQVYELAFA